MLYIILSENKILTEDLVAANLEFGEGIPDDDEFWSNKLADPCLA